MSEVSHCALCGEPMQPGEEMFKYHGSLGPCPKPPLPKPQIKVVIEYILVKRDDGFWIDIHADRQPLNRIGPFNTEVERQRAHHDLLSMMRSVGAKDLPSRAQ